MGFGISDKVGREMNIQEQFDKELYLPPSPFRYEILKRNYESHPGFIEKTINNIPEDSIEGMLKHCAVQKIWMDIIKYRRGLKESFLLKLLKKAKALDNMKWYYYKNKYYDIGSYTIDEATRDHRRDLGLVGCHIIL